MRVLIILVVFACLINSSVALSGPRDGVQSYVILLVDLSNSYYGEERKGIIKENIHELVNAVASKRNGPKKAVMTTVLPINAESESARKLCEWTILKRKMVKAVKEERNKKVKPALYKAYMESLCVNNIFKEQPAHSTDIQGALSLAGQFGETHYKARKYLVIFSDMFEFRNTNIPVTRINLEKFRVLVVCSNVRSEDANLCMGERRKWDTALSKLGVEKTTFVREGTNWGGGVAKAFFKK